MSHRIVQWLGHPSVARRGEVQQVENMQCCGQPSMICCIRSCRTWSSLVAFWIWIIWLWTYGWLVISCIVSSKPLMTVISLGLSLLSTSATTTLCPGRYLIVMSYGCNFNSSLCNLGGASPRCFKCMFLRG